MDWQNVLGVGLLEEATHNNYKLWHIRANPWDPLRCPKADQSGSLRMVWRLHQAVPFGLKLRHPSCSRIKKVHLFPRDQNLFRLCPRSGGKRLCRAVYLLFEGEPILGGLDVLVLSRGCARQFSSSSIDTIQN